MSNAKEGDAAATLTVIIPVRNERQHLGTCLESVMRALDEMDAEVLVIDGGSNDGSIAIAESWVRSDSRIRILRNPQQLTAAAFNVGISEGRGERLAIVSAHSTVEPGFFRAACARLDEGLAEVVGGPITTVPERPGVCAWLLAQVVRHRFGVGNSQFRVAADARYVDAVPFAVFERSVFRRVGLFDTSLGRNQDTDLFGRIAAAGLRVYMDPTVRSTYRARGTLSGLARQGFGNAYWNVLVWRRTPSAFRVRHAVPGAFAAAILGLGLCSVATPALAIVLCVLLLTYALGASVAAIDIALRTGRLVALTLPPVFFTYHLSYGLGSIVGLRWVFTTPRRRV